MGGSYKRVFDPLDLAIIDLVYEAALVQIAVAREPLSDPIKEVARRAQKPTSRLTVADPRASCKKGKKRLALELMAETRVEGSTNLIGDPEMYLRHALAVALIVGCAAPAFAAKGFWIVRGPDKKCVVVETEPSATETTITRVGKDVYVTREEAEADVAVVCK